MFRLAFRHGLSLAGLLMVYVTMQDLKAFHNNGVWTYLDSVVNEATTYVTVVSSDLGTGDDATTPSSSTVSPVSVSSTSVRAGAWPPWPTKNNIRKWGCGMTDTPLIFVHIGKAGGGGVRARIAASALNYTRAKWQGGLGEDFDQSYYPVRRVENGENVTYRATFCNSAYVSFRPKATFRTFEPVLPCNATTPIGQALACPEPFRTSHVGCPTDPSRQESAHVVYTGHNFFGFEIHWLPAPLLDQWWQTYWGYPHPSDNASTDSPWKALAKNDSQITELDILPAESVLGGLWQTLDGNRAWCNDMLRRPALTFPWPRDKNLMLQCGHKVASTLDELAVQAISRHRSMVTPAQRGRAWSDVYASLPVVRVTVVRDPFSWLVSKFFWHSLHNQYNLTCDDIEEATYGSGHPDVFHGAESRERIPLADSPGKGWARRMSIGYMEQLCGEDCIARFERQGHFDLEELEAQAEYNLRNAFAVVGILEDTDVFYDMVSARVDFMNMSLNQHVRGGRHSSGGKGSDRCKVRFKDPQFQAELMTASPEIAALARLYKVGVEVNQFQRNELQECSGVNL